MSFGKGINWGGETPIGAETKSYELSVTYGAGTPLSATITVGPGTTGLEIANQFREAWNSTAPATGVVAEIFTDIDHPGGTVMLYPVDSRTISALTIRDTSSNDKPTPIQEYTDGVLGYGPPVTIIPGILIHNARPIVMVRADI